MLSLYQHQFALAIHLVAVATLLFLVQLDIHMQTQQKVIKLDFSIFE